MQNFLKRALVEIMVYLGTLILCLITGVVTILGGIYIFLEYGIQYLPQ